jgi:hypothetical protein
LTAHKTPVQKMLALRCEVPYALEGMVRRELQLAGAALQAVKHDRAVQFEFTAAQSDAAVLVARLNEAGQGALEWLE